MPADHSEVLLSVVQLLRHNMGAEKLCEPDHLRFIAKSWGFDADLVATGLTGDELPYTWDSLAPYLSERFSPHDFEKMISILPTLVGKNRIDNDSMNYLLQLSDASGHGAETMVGYLNEGTFLHAKLFGGG